MGTTIASSINYDKVEEYKSAFHEAITTIAGAAVESHRKTDTFDAEIIALVDANLNKYLIEYLGQKLTAYSLSTNVKYNPKDKVIVQMLDGTLDGQLSIMGARTPYVGLYTPTEVTDDYIQVGDSVFGFNGGNTISLCTYRTEKSDKIGLDKKFRNTLFNTYLTNYRTFCFSMNVRTNILDPLQRSSGNYGITIGLPFIQKSEEGKADEKTWKEYTFDIYQMLGNPYAFEKDTNQAIYITFADDLTYDVSRNPYMTYFIEGFNTSSDSSIADDVFIKNIQFYPVDVIPAQALTGYYLTLTASQGKYFLNTEENVSFKQAKTITPTLKVNGNDTSINNCECYWFVEDASIIYSSEYYNSYGGPGWRCLNPKETIVASDSSSKDTLVTDILEWIVNIDDVVTTLKYKCVILYNGVLVSQTILLENLSSKIKIDVYSLKNLIVKNTGSVQLGVDVIYQGEDKSAAADLIYSWNRYLANEEYQSNNFYNVLKEDIYSAEEQEIETDNDGTKIVTVHKYHSEIEFPANLIQDISNSFTCTVYSVEGTSKKLLGSDRVVITPVDSANYYLTIVNGDKLYKYDADGDSPMLADYDGPVSSKINAIEPITFVIHKKDGTELTEEEYSYCKTTWKLPKNSMMDFDIDNFKIENSSYEITENNTHYIATGGSRSNIPYKILPMFNHNMIDNTIGLEVEVNRIGDVVQDNTTITFLKEGESGTNGTKYTVLLKHRSFDNSESYSYDVTDGNGVNHKLQLVFIGDKNAWYYRTSDAEALRKFEGTKFEVEVYRDGALITDTNEYKIPNWTIFDQEGIKVENRMFEFSGTQLIAKRLWTDIESEIPVYIAQAKVEVTDTSTTGKNQIIYPTYPIEITYIPTMENAAAVPTLVGGFANVLYTNDSTNPKYNQADPFYMKDKFSESDLISEGYHYEWEVGPNSDNLKLLNADADRGETEYGDTRRVKPADKFDNGEVRNYVRVALTIDNNIAKGIQDKIDILVTEKNDKVINQKLYAKVIPTLESAVTSAYYPYLESLRVLETNDIVGYRELAHRQLVTTKIILDEFYALCGKYKNVEHILDNFDYETKYTQKDYEITQANRKLYVLIAEGVTLDTLAPIYKETITEEGVIVTEGTLQLSAEEALYIHSVMLTEDANKIIDLAYQYDKNIAVYKQYYDILTKRIDNENPDEDGEFFYAKDLLLLQGIYEKYKTFVNSTYFKNIATLSNAKDAAKPGIDDPRFNSFVNNVIENFGFFKYDSKKDYWSKSQIIDVLNDIHILMSKYYVVAWNVYDGEERAETAVANHIIDEYSKIDEEYTKELDRLNEEITKLESGLKLDSAAKIVHVRPIIFKNNTYAYSYLNDWDGGKLYTGENDEFLIAPVIGAGKKNEDNTFTGITMGIKKINKLTNQIGLFGHSKGRQSIFLDAETGKAEFGLAGSGQIIIDPNADEENQGVIRSGNYKEATTNEAGEGMEINFTKPSINFGSGAFSVNENGEMNATGAGHIAGWQIGHTSLDSDNGYLHMDSAAPAIYSHKHNAVDNVKEGFYLGPDGLSIGKSFRATDNLLYVGNVNGNKKWTISGADDGVNSYISYNASAFDEQPKNNSVYIGTDGLRLGKKFQVEASTGITEVGNLTGKHWIIDGDDESYIWYGPDTAMPQLNSGNGTVYIGTDGISLSENKFWVTNQGYLTAKKGNIAGWEFDTNKLMSAGDTNDTRIKIRASGAIEGGYFDADDRLDTNKDYWKINRDGDAYFSKIDARGKITATSGRFGNVSINGDGSINNGSGFRVDVNGNLTAVNAKFTNGDFQGKITSTAGEIGGWTIGQTYLKGGNLTLNSDGSIIGPNWDINSSGLATFNKIVANNTTGESSLNWGENFSVDEDGRIFAKAGSIAGFEIDNVSLQNADKTFILYSSSSELGGYLIQGPNNFYVNGKGSLQAHTAGATVLSAMNANYSDAVYQFNGSNGEAYLKGNVSFSGNNVVFKGGSGTSAVVFQQGLTANNGIQLIDNNSSTYTLTASQCKNWDSKIAAFGNGKSGTIRFIKGFNQAADKTVTNIISGSATFTNGILTSYS